MKFSVPVAFVLLLASIPAPPHRAQAGPHSPTSSAQDASSTAYMPVHAFDTNRDAAADIKAAVAQAQRTHKRVILYIGGDWCPYCRQLGQLFSADPPLLKLRDASFITVYVYYGPGNHNGQALSSYGKFVGVPHYFILDSNGSLLHSEHLIDLRSNRDYSPEKMKQFLTQWAPPPKSADLAATAN